MKKFLFYWRLQGIHLKPVNTHTYTIIHNFCRTVHSDNHILWVHRHLESKKTQVTWLIFQSDCSTVNKQRAQMRKKMRIIFKSLQLYQMKAGVANLGHYLCCSKCACAKQWGPDPGEAVGVAVLSFTTPICRCPDSGTGIRNIQFLLLELRLCFFIRRAHQVNLPGTDSCCS